MPEKERQFLTHVEIPIWVHYDVQPEDPMTLTYPGCKAEITMNDITVADDIKEWIMEKYKDQLEMECWDNLEGEMEYIKETERRFVVTKPLKLRRWGPPAIIGKISRED